MTEGNGIAYYFFGVSNDGIATGITQKQIETSLICLFAMAEGLDSEVDLKEAHTGDIGDILIVEVREKVDYLVT